MSDVKSMKDLEQNADDEESKKLANESKIDAFHRIGLWWGIVHHAASTRSNA